jgi:hypothetical protein
MTATQEKNRLTVTHTSDGKQTITDAAGNQIKIAPLPDNLKKKYDTGSAPQVRDYTQSTPAPGAGNGAGGKELTEEQQEFLALTKNAQSKPVEVVEVGGKKRFIKRLDFSELTRLTMLTPRDDDNRLDMMNPDDLRALTKAMLFCCLMADEHGNRPYFKNFSRAAAWTESVEPAMKNIVALLFTEITRINPDILGGEVEIVETTEQKKTANRKERRAKKG